jgi:UDP-glucose 4-epimerase
MTILVTGGTGYIGSHTVVQLLAAGHDVLILDNLCNSKAKVVDRIAQIAGKMPGFIEGDVRDRSLLKKLFSNYVIQTVIHFAGLKSVAECGQKPLLYYDNNVSGSMCYLKKCSWRASNRLSFLHQLLFMVNPSFCRIPNLIRLNHLMFMAKVS